MPAIADESPFSLLNTASAHLPQLVERGELGSPSNPGFTPSSTAENKLVALAVATDESLTAT